MKKTAQAPSNIAFIKYWGKADETLRLPLNDSLSMNLSGAYTQTTVDFSPDYGADTIELLDGVFSEKEIQRVILSLDRIRQRAGSSFYAKVVTRNTFPKGAGAAASASGFAALTVASFASLEHVLSEKELTIFARMGSGSACRSIPDGFVIWEKGNDSTSSYAHSIYPPEYWDIRDALVIVDSHMKKVSTSDGMEDIQSSPLLQPRLRAVPMRMRAMKEAFDQKNFEALGNVIEEDCLDMHQVMQTQVPPLIYWNETTKKVMEAVSNWRKEGLPVYYTIDAGPNVHVIYEGIYEQRVLDALKTIEGIESIIANKASTGTHLVDTHLF